VSSDNLIFFRVAVKETDLAIYAESNLEKVALESAFRHREYLENYIEANPGFKDILAPWETTGPCASIIREMTRAGKAAGVGPMAAVAGSVAERVGKDLLEYSSQVIVENGGDVFLKTNRSATVAIFAGKSPLSLKLGVKISCEFGPMAVCTSSGAFGHSKSMGRADAVCVVSRSCPIADAAATAIGNRVSSAVDIPFGIEWGKKIEEMLGIVIIVKNKIGAWGDLELVRVREKY
jgi:ApbE superfamily uncharacterized protein (UPF0280 family)